jgi:SAM-dependent methyltransferase
LAQRPRLESITHARRGPDLMSMFTWTAPLFGRFGDRWSEDTLAWICGRLRPFLPRDGQPGSLLDLGGGTGALAVRLADLTRAHVSVVDATPEMLGYVPEHPLVDATLGTAEAIPFATGAFDAVVVSDAFHHFADQQQAAQEIARVTRPGGGLVILEMTPAGWGRPLVLAERLVGEPAYFLRPEELHGLFETQGFEGVAQPERLLFYRYVGRLA